MEYRIVNLQRIQKIRPHIPQPLHLPLRLPLHQIIPPPTPPPRILPLQQHPHQKTPAKKKNRQIRQHNPMPRSILRRRSSLIDIRAHNAVEISPANDETHRDAAFVDAFGVVGDPDDGVGDAGVDS